MPYREPIFFEGGVYHVYNRGLLKQKIFLRARDFLRYKKRLLELMEELPFELLGYCLMPNHFHLLVVQKSAAVSVTDLMKRLLGGYGKYFNQVHKRKGGIFEGRFQAKLIGTDEYLLQVSKYIHQNPIKAGLTKTKGELANYEWSSYRYYLSEVCEQNLNIERILGYFPAGKERELYQKFVEENFENERELLMAEELIDADE